MSAAANGAGLCKLYGLCVSSAIPLNHDRPVSLSRLPDVTLTFDGVRPVPVEPPAGELIAEVSNAERSFFTFATRADGHHVLRFHGAVEFVVNPDLAVVRTYVAREEDQGFAAVLATGTLMSFLLMMRGEPVLHASAVEIDGGVLAFVGSSGMGKSTMATLMCAAGAKLFTDDVLRLDLAGGAVRCHLGATETRLRKSASELVAAFGDAPEHRRTGDERDALRIPASTTDLAPLRAIVVPMPCRDRDDVELVRLHGIEALVTLARFPRILGWQQAVTQQRQFEHLADVVERVPVYLGHVPWGPPFAADIAEQVLAGARMWEPSRAL